MVNPVGERTKLEHMGKHLYLIACPSQHGLSNFFLGSLSQVIGFLPADKELQTQKSASRSSSSSPDLEEEPTKPQVEQDSLNLQCHPVLQETSDEDGDPSFDLVPGKEEVADTGGEPQATSFHPKSSAAKATIKARKGAFPFNLGVWCVKKQKEELLSIRSRKPLPRPRRYSLTMRTSGSLKTKSQRPS